ncbi:MAG: heavy metal translocating P-type ATPase [Planctomycetes bacterium]|nr:heavy metal translocating P-type ATPase [Planctomycetota bacterium]MCC7169609.1 heavy metal translocating P-type ATPase [Planctomycetota bacterium]
MTTDSTQATPAVESSRDSRSRSTSVACAHCGLDVPRARVADDGGPSFCCPGCATVYATIHALALDRYYALQGEDSARQPATVSGRSFESLDHAAFLAEHVRTREDGASEVVLALEGVHCAACVWLVERLPRVLPGVIDARLDRVSGRATLRYEPATVSLSAIARTLDGLGYPPHANRGAARQEARRARSRKHVVDLGVAGACAGNTMLFAFALYGGHLDGMDPMTRTLLRGVSLAFTLLSLAWPGRVFFQGAWTSLRTRVPHMDLPVALALTIGTLFGAWNTVLDRGDTYFESLTVVVFLLLIGRFLQEKRSRDALDAVDLLFSVTDATARKVDADVERETPIEALVPGDRIRVRHGESVAADGMIERGTAAFDVAFLTGESKPRTLRVGDRVLAGSRNQGGEVDVVVEAAGPRTRAGRLMDTVRAAAETKSPIVRTVDAMARRFTVVVLVLAAITAAVWWNASPEQAIQHAVALLIVTCPCALGLATPLAVTVALGRAAKRGVLIRGADVAEALCGPALVVLDKTGTVTTGTMQLCEWSGPAVVLERVAALESGVEHPIAVALSQAVGNVDEVVSRRHVEPGFGVEGVVNDEAIVVGSPRYVERAVGELPAGIKASVERVRVRGLTPVVCARAGRVEAVGGLGDAIRPEAKAAVQALRELGHDVVLLSGDEPAVAFAIGRDLGLDERSIEGLASPERKLDRVRSAVASGRRVFMVGDGVNDAAALAAATVGIAVSGGAEASLEAADVYLAKPGLEPLLELMRGSRRTLRAIHRCLRASLMYNAVNVALAMTGVLNPLVAAVLMPLSSLTVVTLAFRAHTFGDEP